MQFVALDDALLTVDDDTVTERFDGHEFECVVAGPNRVFAGTFEAGLYRREDGGSGDDDWHRVGDSLPDSVTAVALDPHDGDGVWVGTEPSRVFHSADGGDSWTERTGLTDLPSADSWYFPPRPDTHHIRWLEPDPHREGRLYVGIEAGALVVTDDGGETWTERPGGSRRDNHQLATHPAAVGRVYSAAGDGYAESTDHGRTWVQPQSGLDHRYCWSVAVDPGDPDLRVVSAASGASRAHRSGTAESYVYRKHGDDPWEVSMGGLPEPEGFRRPVLAPAGHGTFLAAADDGLYRSEDGGRSWKQAVTWDETGPVRGLAIR
ncbi:WD40/YVTN/BNR-like repeat-containing protein [Haloarchaeobius litoreus]|uniref:Sialidase family protein n=1 Tax=Haloarchaeobius litoreus TaxID=755306 RepID=A0ABD6DE66_9EURY|nr:sialidase family protein [Haloarchaeobius litoreus]